MLSMIKEKRNKVLNFVIKSRSILIGSFIILVGFGILIFNVFDGYQYQKIDDQYINEFFEEGTEEVIVDSDGQIVKTISSEINYIAVLEVPGISLKRGLVDPSSKDNNVNRNIEILTPSDMPDVINGNLILAGHSGSGWNAFFKKLNNVKIDDLVNLYYSGNKYVYQITNIYNETKDGSIVIHRDNSKSVITLTTCDMNNKDQQLIVVAELIEINSYGGNN